MNVWRKRQAAARRRENKERKGGPASAASTDDANTATLRRHDPQRAKQLGLNSLEGAPGLPLPAPPGGTDEIDDAPTGE